MLITGANGFIGRALSVSLANLGHNVVAISRNAPSYKSKSRCIEWHLQKNLTLFDDLSLFEGVGCIVHLAGRAHVLNERSSDPETAFLQANRDTTNKLSQVASQCGVKRFIFLSSIGVHGNNSGVKPFSENSELIPYNAYTRSKLMAENCLFDICSASSLEAVVIRPPLVYGPGTKGSFLSLLRWLNKGIPLPLGAINNQRSLIGIDNLVDLIITCIDHPAAANQNFLVSDNEDLSTTELLVRMRNALRKSTYLLPVPSSLLELGVRSLGKKDVAQRLLGNLQVDISYTKKKLNWMPPVSLDEGLKKTAEWFLNKR